LDDGSLALPTTAFAVDGARFSAVDTGLRAVAP
jgi:hypothetical protein